MRSIALFFSILLWSSWIPASDINISTHSDKGVTSFYLQAGAYTLEKDAKKRQHLLARKISEPVEIKNLADKSLFLVQIGPIADYTQALALQNKLSEHAKVLPSMLPSFQTKPAVKPVLTDKKLWNLRNADVRAVIAEVSRVTGKNFVIDPRVQAKVSIVSATPITDQALYQVFLSALQVSGYTAIPTGDIIKIVPNMDAKTLSPDLINTLRHPPQGEDMMVSVVPVHYVPAEQLVPVLRPLMPQWSNVSAYAPSNMLILAGRANNIRSLTQIIKQVDSSSSTGIDIVPLRHALAMDVVNSLKEIVKNQPNVGSRTPISISADDRSNAILLSGSKTDRIRLRLLLLKMDRGSSDGLNSTTQVVYLNYLRAEDLVPILAGIAQANFSGTVGTTIGTITRPVLDSTNPASSLVPTSSAGGGQSGVITNPILPPQSPAANAGGAANTSSATTQNEGSSKPTIQIIAEPNTNSIILNAPASIIRILKKVIVQLDIKPAQLLIEAIVAEVNQSDLSDLGIEWGSNQQTGKVTDFRPGFAIINSKTKLQDFQAQIYALAREEKANILSTPSVVVLDNRQAKILVGKQVSIASTSYPNNAGGTTTASPFTTFDRVNVALHLYVRPQITRGEGIQLQIDQGNDTLDPSSTLNTTNNPTFKISSIVTSVHVESGDIVVLGGLTQDSLGHNDNHLPIIGDLPGVGHFFQRNIRSREKRVLMVFIKPIILHNEKDTVEATSAKYEDTRQYQLDWLRSQEHFIQTDEETVLPPLVIDSLPRPFSGPEAVIVRRGRPLPPPRPLEMTK